MRLHGGRAGCRSGFGEELILFDAVEKFRGYQNSLQHEPNRVDKRLAVGGSPIVQLHQLIDFRRLNRPAVSTANEGGDEVTRSILLRSPRSGLDRRFRFIPRPRLLAKHQLASQRGVVAGVTINGRGKLGAKKAVKHEIGGREIFVQKRRRHVQGGRQIPKAVAAARGIVGHSNRLRGMKTNPQKIADRVVILRKTKSADKGRTRIAFGARVC